MKFKKGINQNIEDEHKKYKYVNGNQLMRTFFYVLNQLQATIFMPNMPQPLFHK